MMIHAKARGSKDGFLASLDKDIAFIKLLYEKDNSAHTATLLGALYCVRRAWEKRGAPARRAARAHARWGGNGE